MTIFGKGSKEFIPETIHVTLPHIVLARDQKLLDEVSRLCVRSIFGSSQILLFLENGKRETSPSAFVCGSCSCISVRNGLFPTICKCHHC